MRSSKLDHNHENHENLKRLVSNFMFRALVGFFLSEMTISTFGCFSVSFLQTHISTKLYTLFIQTAKIIH